MYLKTIAVLVSLIAHSNFQASPFGGTAGEFYESCKEDGNSNLTYYCIGYLKSYRDWYQATKDSKNELIHSNLHYCEPDDLDYRKIKNAVVEYLENNQSLWGEPRIVGVGKALHSRWPCPDQSLWVTQGLLNRLGYNAGTPNGFYSDQTRSAIKQYQKCNNMTVNGENTILIAESILNSTVTGKEICK